MRYPEGFEFYRLPHHDVQDGKLVTVKAGVIAAGNAIQGARGGLKLIPAEDMAPVKAHLETHYEQFDMEAPWDKKIASDERTMSGDALNNSELKPCKFCMCLNDKSRVECVKCGEEMGDDEGGDEQAGEMKASAADNTTEMTADGVVQTQINHEGVTQMKLLLNALGLVDSANEAAAIEAVGTIKASATAATAATKTLLTAKSALCLSADATEEQIIAKVTELTSASSKVVTLAAERDAALAEIAKRDDLALASQVDVVIKRGAAYGFKFSDSEPTRKMLTTCLRSAPEAFKAEFKAIFDGVAAGDNLSDFRAIATAPSVATSAVAAGKDGAEAALKSQVDAYIKKMADKGTPVSSPSAAKAAVVLANIKGQAI